MTIVVLLHKPRSPGPTKGPNIYSDVITFVREMVDRGDVKICKVAGKDNVADPLTKPLARVIHERHVTSMGIRHINGCT